MQTQLLTQAEFVLSKCGRPAAPRGFSSVYVPKAFLVQAQFAAATTAVTQTITKEITGSAQWALEAISITSSPSTAIAIQVQLPNGRFLINNLQDVLQIAGYGSYRYLVAEELLCNPGEKIVVTLSVTNTTDAQPIAILFEGAYRYLLRGGSQCNAVDPVKDVPRYLRNCNENIMAPCWLQGYGPATPKGLSDIEWVYPSSGLVTNAAGVTLQGATAISVAGPYTAIQTIPIDTTSDFRCRRLMFQVTADAGVTAGTFLGRVRTGSGYALTDDYIDLETYLGSSPMPHDWEIKAGDTVYIDLALVDYAGTGNCYLQTYLEGTKRTRRMAA